jgi:hypothetical protein
MIVYERNENKVLPGGRKRLAVSTAPSNSPPALFLRSIISTSTPSSLYNYNSYNSDINKLNGYFWIQMRLSYLESFSKEAATSWAVEVEKDRIRTIPTLRPFTTVEEYMTPCILNGFLTIEKSKVSLLSRNIRTLAFVSSFPLFKKI